MSTSPASTQSHTSTTPTDATNSPTNLEDIFATSHNHPSDSPRLRSIHATAGYRDGASAAREAAVQGGFDEGYLLGAAIGARAGVLIGIVEGIVAAGGLTGGSTDGLAKGLTEGPAGGPAGSLAEYLTGASSTRSGEGLAEGSARGVAVGAVPGAVPGVAEDIARNWSNGNEDGNSTKATGGRDDSGDEVQAKAAKLLERMRRDLALENVLGPAFVLKDGTWGWDVAVELMESGGVDAVAEAHPVIRRYAGVVGGWVRRLELRRVGEGVG
ncbi:MAG: hypothetical protein GOMPHAMPRED_007746 [Gomphillus americanus]|uniref:Protein YAE1 n=1 Tax=Gomphillus americanus TaxID=1940652 RepID=A0A8H3EYQ2_9LECA|nr:MAG: hypothetical protein GOMPHAMPRED_007746 [Gomphillus americanus]